MRLRRCICGTAFAIAFGFVVLFSARAQAPAPPQNPGPSSGVAAPSPPMGPPAPPGAPGGRGGFVFTPPYPVRPAADPAALARGKQIFSVNCSFCHGADARGGETGPNLIRSQLVMDDKDGELISTVVENGRPDKGMPKFDLSRAEVSDIAAFIHNFAVGGRTEPTGTVDPLIGNAKAGEAYFNASGKCSTCHSVTGDLARIGAKYADVRALQGAWLSGGGGGGFFGPPSASAGPPTKVKITFPSGKTVEGKLDRMDDFNVSLIDSSGVRHNYRRDGDVPKIVVTNPLQPHLDLLRTYKDEDIHDVTAYLVTLK